MICCRHLANPASASCLGILLAPSGINGRALPNLIWASPPLACSRNEVAVIAIVYYSSFSHVELYKSEFLKTCICSYRLLRRICLRDLIARLVSLRTLLYGKTSKFCGELIVNPIVSAASSAASSTTSSKMKLKNVTGSKQDLPMLNLVGHAHLFPRAL